MIRRFLVSTRYIMIIPIIGSFLAAVVILIFDLIEVFKVVYEVIAKALPSSDISIKEIAIDSIQVIDLFLLGTVLYIISLGLYELFIDETLPLPNWLRVHTLDDLKASLLGVIVILLAVTFLANVVSWNGTSDILALGIAVGLVLFALGYLLSRTFKVKNGNEQTVTEE